MPLACLTAVAGGVSVGPAVRAGFVVSSFDSGLGQFARCFLLSGAWHLGVAATDSADTSTGVSRFASRCGWLAVVESGGGLAGRCSCGRTAWRCRWSWCCVFVCGASGGSDRSACPGIRRRRICTDACGFGSRSVGVGGRHQNSVQRDRQQVRVVEGVMQAATFLALHG